MKGKLLKQENCHNLLNQWQNILFTNFKYYSKYNNISPLKITIKSWNRGIRVSFPEFYPQGDDGGSLKFGTSVFTKDTDDAQSKGIFQQRYYDFNMNILGGNGNLDTLAIYARRR